MNVELNLEVEVKGRASSRYDRRTVERRLVLLAGRRDLAALREAEYLRQLLRKKGG